jgi:hypothetical protein
MKVGEYRELPPEGHPLRELGELLADYLNEDHWAKCEKLLLDAWDHERALLTRV